MDRSSPLSSPERTLRSRIVDTVVLVAICEALEGMARARDLTGMGVVLEQLDPALVRARVALDRPAAIIRPDHGGGSMIQAAATIEVA